MNGLRVSRSILDISKRLGNLNIYPNAPKIIKESTQDLQKKDERISIDLCKNHDLALTALYWANQIKPKLEIIDPTIRAPVGRDCNDESVIIPPTSGPKNSPMEDPLNIQNTEKKAERMLRIRKKKMKVHRRKKRWKRYWVIFRKKYAMREKKREIEFRQRMIVKLNEANKFDANKYVDEYLEDLKYQLIPKTYKGRRLPQWLIKEILEEDQRKIERKRKDETNLLTGDPLIFPNESVSDFVKRITRK